MALRARFYTRSLAASTLPHSPAKAVQLFPILAYGTAILHNSLDFTSRYIR